MPNLAVPSSSPPPLTCIGCLAAPRESRRLSGSVADSGPSSTGDPKAQSTSSWTWTPSGGDLRPSCETPPDDPAQSPPVPPPAAAAAAALAEAAMTLELESAAQSAVLTRDDHTMYELQTASAVAAAMVAHTTAPTPVAVGGGAATIRRCRTPSPPLPPGVPANGSGGDMGSVGSASFALPVVETDRAVHRTSRKGKPVINNYVVDCEIGEGKFSTVRLVKHSKSKRTYAMKIISRSCLAQLRLMADGDDRARLYRHEMAVLKRLRHPHIIALVEVIDDPVEQNLYLILELASEGPLAFVNRCGRTVSANGAPYRLDEASARDVARALLAAIRYAHHNGVAHRDIKPENILRAEDGSLKLADFGVAKMIEDWPELRGDARELMLDPALAVSVDHPERDNPHSPTGRKVPGQETHGTPFFMSPESLSAAVRGIPEGIALDLSDLFLSDIWSFGVTMYALVVGRLPWTAASARGMALAIAADATVPFPPECDDLSASLKDFLTAAIRVDPGERVSLRQLAHHPWVLGDPSWAAAAKSVALADGYSFTPSFPSAALLAASGAGPATHTGSDVGASAFSNFSFDGAGGMLAAGAAAVSPPAPHAAPLFGVSATLPAPSVPGEEAEAEAGQQRRARRRSVSIASAADDDDDEGTTTTTVVAAADGRAEPERGTSLSDSFAGETVRVDNEDLQDALASLQAMSITAGDLSFGGVGDSQHQADDSSGAPPLPIECDDAPAAMETAAPSPAAPPGPMTPFNVSPPAALTTIGSSETPASTSPQSCVLSPYGMSTTQVFSSACGSTLASPSGSRGQAPHSLPPPRQQSHGGGGGHEMAAEMAGELRQLPDGGNGQPDSVCAR